jgi:hypothetical protein
VTPDFLKLRTSANCPTATPFPIFGIVPWISGPVVLKALVLWTNKQLHFGICFRDLIIRYIPCFRQWPIKDMSSGSKRSRERIFVTVVRALWAGKRCYPTNCLSVLQEDTTMVDAGRWILFDQQDRRRMDGTSEACWYEARSVGGVMSAQ